MTQRSLPIALALASVFLSISALRAEDPAPSVSVLSKANLLAPKAFRAASKKVLPSLVTIESFGGVSGAAAGVGLPGDGPTTGLIVSPDGYIITSTFNFLKRPPVITVVFRDGKRHVAKLLGRDDTRKLCLLKVDDVENLPVPEFVPRSELKVGQWAVAVGVGYGDANPALSAGIISATSRISGKAVQTDANTSPANYGGPLVDLDGRVIGVCVPLSPGSKEVAAGVEWYDSGIAFAVPLSGAEQLIAALKEGKTLVPGQLGVQPKPPAEGGGAGIAKVQKDTPADKAGLKEEDVILAISGEIVLDPTHLRTVLGRYYAGDKVKVRYKRGVEEKEVEVELAVVPDPPPMPNPKLVPKRPQPEKPEQKEPEEKKPDDKKPEEKKPDSPE